MLPMITRSLSNMMPPLLPKFVLRIRSVSSSNNDASAAIGNGEPSSSPPPPVPAEMRMNLRPRVTRTSSSPPMTKSTGKKTIKEKETKSTTAAATEDDNQQLERPKRRKVEPSTSKRSPQKPKTSNFTMSLARDEIEADYMSITGAKPPRKPRRRPKKVQDELDLMYPGYDLPKTTLAPDSYR